MCDRHELRPDRARTPHLTFPGVAVCLRPSLHYRHLSFPRKKTFASLCEDGSYLDGVFVFSYGTCVEGGPVVSGRKLFPEEGANVDVTVYVTD